MSRKLLSPKVLFTVIDKYTFRVIILIIFLNKQMSQILMITVKYVFIVGSFTFFYFTEINQIDVFPRNIFI